MVLPQEFRQYFAVPGLSEENAAVNLTTLATYVQLKYGVVNSDPYHHP